MQYSHMLGVDISKHTIDLALSQNKASAAMINKKLTNNLKGYKALLVWLIKEKVALEQVLICLENTGIYHRSLVAFLQRQQAFVWVETPVAIKWSQGIARGKNDKVDAQRIYLYAYRNQDKAKAYNAMDKSLQELADLLGARDRLIQARNSLLVPIKEMKQVGLEAAAEKLEQAYKSSILALEQGIKAIEARLLAIVESEQRLKQTYQIILPVRSVGLVTALYLMVYSYNFERFESAKKLASYCGLAPFEYSSGTSIRAKTKVHPMANKQLKTALHMNCVL